MIQSEPPTLLEEAQRERTFSLRVRYRLEPAGERTRLTVEDEISFLAPARHPAGFARRADELAALPRAAGSSRGSARTLAVRGSRLVGQRLVSLGLG